VGAGGEMTQALYAHMNKKKKRKEIFQSTKPSKVSRCNPGLRQDWGTLC
jgi:hypothetical protein